jgi:hypothetical protein
MERAGTDGMLIFDELDNRFYLNEHDGISAQRNIEQNEIIMVNGIAVKKNSIADSCTAYVNNYKFATLHTISKRDYQYYIIALGFCSLIRKTTEDANVSLEYDKVGNIIFRFIKPVAVGEEILYKDSE